jgi:hypothetical protein
LYNYNGIRPVSQSPMAYFKSVKIQWHQSK